jgi:translation elongation factor EF-G
MSELILDTIFDMSSDGIELEGLNISLDPIVDVMLFHAGQSRQEELSKQNPRDPVTKVYVAIRGMGIYSADAVLDGLTAAGVRLTNLEMVNSIKEFIHVLSKDVDRSGAGWNMVAIANVECIDYVTKHL